MAGPFELIQGGIGFVARRPLFTSVDNKFWDFATLVIDFETIVKVVENRTLKSGYLVALRGTDSKGKYGSVFYGPKNVFEDNPVLANIAMPNGSWQIGIIPQNGWPTSSPYSGLLWFFGTVIASITGFLVHRLLLTMHLLRLSQGQAVKANSEKSAFLAAASHDMRQPLQAMNLYLYALKNDKTSPGNRELVGLVEQSAASLGKLLDRLLDLSRLEAGVINTEKQAFSVRTMFRNLFDEFDHIATEKGLKLAFAPCSAHVYSDQVLLEGVLRNLISNAIRYTDSGRVLIGCRRKSADQLQFQVWDTGDGIAKEQQGKIFDEFYQIGANVEQSEKGLGLGLSIVRKIAVLLNHELGVSSVLGRGTMFFVSVPLYAGPRVHEYKHVKPAPLNTPENLSIIVIDDEEDVRNSLSIMLSTLNNRVVTTADVDCLNETEMQTFPEHAPDIIIADYRLGNDRTGVEAITDLCAFYEKDIPAILLTGDTAPRRLQEIAQSGYPLLHKPVSGDQLLSQIKDILN